MPRQHSVVLPELETMPRGHGVVLSELETMPRGHGVVLSEDRMTPYWSRACRLSYSVAQAVSGVTQRFRAALPGRRESGATRSVRHAVRVAGRGIGHHRRFAVLHGE